MTEYLASQPARATGTVIARKAMNFQTLVSLIIKINRNSTDDAWASLTIAATLAAYGLDKFHGQYNLWLTTLELEVYETFGSDDKPDTSLLRDVCRVSRLDGALAMIDNHGYDSPVSCLTSDRLFALSMVVWPGHKLHNGAEFGREFDAILRLKDN